MTENSAGYKICWCAVISFAQFAHVIIRGAKVERRRTEGPLHIFCRQINSLEFTAWSFARSSCWLNNSGGTWRRICSPDIRNASALEVLRNRAPQLDIYLLTYLPMGDSLSTCFDTLNFFVLLLMLMFLLLRNRVVWCDCWNFIAETCLGLWQYMECYKKSLLISQGIGPTFKKTRDVRYITVLQ